ncbi:hypothetical protein [Allomuricauda sp. CP2A]|uniref:hypothetical protein n=1 Tax=Allomuricauda sp. CP2A TaxID=1848189 RepID=UPI000835FDA1|nr:hypothetical protein [Muricauda sp. CP2A]
MKPTIRKASIGVFPQFHFDLKIKNRNSLFSSPETAHGNFDLSKGEVKRTDKINQGQSPEEFYD